MPAKKNLSIDEIRRQNRERQKRFRGKSCKEKLKLPWVSDLTCEQRIEFVNKLIDNMKTVAGDYLVLEDFFEHANKCPECMSHLIAIMEHIQVIVTKT